MKLIKLLLSILIAGCVLLLSGCKLALFDPAGMIAAKEAKLIIDATALMCVIVIPVIILTIAIAIRYRKGNKKADYKPKWSHSVAIESICWTIPIIIIVILGTITWISTHDLDPYKTIKVKGKQPLIIDAVALDWRWLFIYPKQHIAAINDIYIPVKTPITFRISADAPMNSLEIPRLAGQIYAMGGMQTRLNLIADKIGTYKGLSTNYSGDGFAGMIFKIHAGTDAQFKAWVHKVQTSPHKLTYHNYYKLVPPTFDHKPMYFSHVPGDLMQQIIESYTMPAGVSKITNLKQ